MRLDRPGLDVAGHDLDATTMTCLGQTRCDRVWRDQLDLTACVTTRLGKTNMLCWDLAGRDTVGLDQA